MKLFGGKQTGTHLAVPRLPRKPEPPKQETPVQPEAPPDPDAKRKKRRRALLIAACGVLLALLACVGVYLLWEKPPQVQQGGLAQPTVGPAMPEPERPTPPPPSPTEAPPETEAPETPEPTEAPHTAQRKENCYTFVILAKDQVGANTDVILVGRLDAGAGTLDLASIPRDTLMNVSWGVKKINTIYVAVDRDMAQFEDYLAGILGYAVDAYAVVNIRAVQKLVDTLGGVNFYVPRSMDYDDPTQELSIHIPEGYRYLSGADVVNVLRFRVGNDGTGYLNGDLGRIETQHALLKSVAASLLKLGNIPNLDRLIEIFIEDVETDMTASNLAYFAREFLTLREENVRFHTAPGRNIGIRGGSYYELDLDGWLEIVNDGLNPWDTDVTASNLDLIRCPDGTVVSTTGETVPLDTFLDFSQLR